MSNAVHQVEIIYFLSESHWAILFDNLDKNHKYVTVLYRL